MADDTARPDGPGRTFHLFSRLPAELRCKIWALNLPGPRAVPIRCGSDDPPPVSSSSPSSPPRLGWSGSCTSPAPVPVNLLVCREARAEALRRYRPAFGIARQPGRVFFDPARDVLYFGPRAGFMASAAQLRTVLTLCDPADLARVRRVAIHDALFWVYGNPHPPSCGNNDGDDTVGNNHDHGRPQQQGPRGDSITNPGGQLVSHTALATSLLSDSLQLLRTRLPGLRELTIVPRDDDDQDNPLLYSDTQDCCCPRLVEVPTAAATVTVQQSRVAQQVREAMAIAFGGGGGCGSRSSNTTRPEPSSHFPTTSSSATPGRRRIGGGRRQQQQQQHTKKMTNFSDDDDDDDDDNDPWTWRIMIPAADPDPPVFHNDGRRVVVLAIDEEQQQEEEEEKQQQPSPPSPPPKQQEPLEDGWEEDDNDDDDDGCGARRVGRRSSSYHSGKNHHKRSVVDVAPAAPAAAEGPSRHPFSSTKEWRHPRRGGDGVAGGEMTRSSVLHRFTQMRRRVCV